MLDKIKTELSQKEWDEKWQKDYRTALIQGIIKIVSESPDKLHTVNLENAFVELQILRDEEGYPIESDFLDM